MDRVYESGAAASPPSAPASPSNGYATAGNPSTGTPPTKPGPWWYHMITEELRALVAFAGLTPSHTDTGQVKAAISRAKVEQLDTAFTSAGTVPNFTLTPAPALTAYAAGQRFRVKFHAAGAGADQLNISGLGNKALKQYGDAGAKVAAVIAANQLADVEYDGVDLVVLDPLPQAGRQIQPISASVAGNALTLTLNPTSLDFRSSTLNSGAVNTRVVGSAISLVVSSGSTLGTVNAVAARLAILAIDNAGTVELAVANLAGGLNLDETTLISTTAEGGAGAADSASVIYSATARTNVPFRVVGFVDITEATAGTWATAPTTVQGVGGQALTAMASLGYGQTWQDVSASRVAGTTYYNTTGKPIAVSIKGTNSTATNNLGLTINGVLVAATGTATTAQSIQTISGVVPPGGAYSASVTGSMTIGLWAELR